MSLLEATAGGLLPLRDAGGGGGRRNSVSVDRRIVGTEDDFPPVGQNAHVLDRDVDRGRALPQSQQRLIPGPRQFVVEVVELPPARAAISQPLLHVVVR